MNVHFSSATDLWFTPQDFYEKLNADFGFDLDVCATPENAKCARFFTKLDDGLTQDWNGVVWMNPPYGREIGKWMKKPTNPLGGGGNGCVPRSISNRYALVARSRNARRGALRQRAAEVRRREIQRAIPMRCSDLPSGI